MSCLKFNLRQIQWIQSKMIVCELFNEFKFMILFCWQNGGVEIKNVFWSGLITSKQNHQMSTIKLQYKVPKKMAITMKHPVG